jgi:hypothetical protein
VPLDRRRYPSSQWRRRGELIESVSMLPLSRIRKVAVTVGVIGALMCLGFNGVVASASGTLRPAVARARSLRITAVDCNGRIIDAYRPPTGQGMPAASLGSSGELSGLSAALRRQLESPSMKWIVPKCGPPLPASEENSAGSGLRPDAVYGKEMNSPNWSGFETRKYALGTFSAVYAGWTIPSSMEDPLPAGYSGFWVGLGTGDSKADSLLQAGTLENTDSESGGILGYPSAFFEVYPMEGRQTIPNFDPRYGDTITTLVEHTGFDKGRVVIVDITHNMSMSFEVKWTKSYAVNNSSADWVVERPTEGPIPQDVTIPTLADFGHVDFTHSKAYVHSKQAWKSMGNLNRNFIWMIYDCTSKPYIAKTGDVTGGGQDWTDTYLGPGKSGIRCKSKS